MNHKEYLKQAWLKMTLWEKIDWIWFRFSEPIKTKFLVLIGKCPHDNTFGLVGAEYQMCIDCHKQVYNEDWKEDSKALKVSLTEGE